LRVANGPVFTGATQQYIYVIRGEQAEKEKITLGLTNMDFVEIQNSNLKEGDRVIISDMKAYDHLDVIDLKK
jgi:HlyD family secretion protein